MLALKLVHLADCCLSRVVFRQQGLLTSSFVLLLVSCVLDWSGHFCVDENGFELQILLVPSPVSRKGGTQGLVHDGQGFHQLHGEGFSSPHYSVSSTPVMLSPLLVARLWKITAVWRDARGANDYW